MLGLILSVLIGVTAAAQEPAAQSPVIIATGRAVVKRAPDVAFVTMTVESRAKSPRDAQRQNADAMAAVVRKMGELGIPKDGLETIGLTLYEDVDNANGRRVSRGFAARNSVEVRIDDIARTGEIADAGVAAGATSIGGIRFDSKGRAAAEREALRLAVAEARARAEAMAAGAGRSLDRILKIEEGAGARPPIPLPRTMAMRAEAVDHGRARAHRAGGGGHAHRIDEMTALRSPETTTSFTAASLTPEGYEKARRLLMRRDPILAAAIKRIGPCGMAGRQRHDHLSALVGAIVSQQLSTKAAATIFARFLALFPEGESLSASAINAQSDAALRGVGLSGQKVSYLRDLGARIDDGRLDLE